MRQRFRVVFILLLGFFALVNSHAAETRSHPYRGITYIVRTETAPRDLTMHIVQIDLSAPGLKFELTPPSGSLETIRSTTLDFLKKEHAQFAINAHFFMPFPSRQAEANLVGFAVSNGRVYSAFENPVQSYAIVADAPALNIDKSNHARIVHWNSRYKDGKHVREKVHLWTAVAGSAQIVTDGVNTVPVYEDEQHPEGLLKPGGQPKLSNANSWYELINARTVIGLSRDNKTLTIFTVDKAAGSKGMSLTEIANLLIQDYGVFNALNLDGGGSTTMAMQDPKTGAATIVNASSDNPLGRRVASNLAIFASPIQ